MKITSILPALLLVGCHEFEGELGTLGFVSNLIVRPDQRWSPAHGVAADSPLEVAAVSIIGVESEERPQVEAAASGSLIALDPTGGDIAITGEAGDRGRLQFWGEAHDRLSIRFAAPVDVALYPPMGADELGDILLQAATPVALYPMILDAWDQPLGWSPELLEAAGCGASVDDSGRILLDGEDCTLTISLDGLLLAEVPIAAIELEDVAPGEEPEAWAALYGADDQERQPETTSTSSAP